MSKTVFDNILSKVSVRPQNIGAATVNGIAVDTKGFANLMAVAEVGAAEGSPSAQTFNAKLQEADTSGGSYTDITGAAITEITADDKSAQIQLLGLGTGTLKRFVRIVVVTTLTGGSTPKIEVAGIILLGQAHNKAVGNSIAGA